MKLLDLQISKSRAFTFTSPGVYWASCAACRACVTGFPLVVGFSIFFMFLSNSFSEKSTWDCMQSFWAIIHFAFPPPPPSDWFIAHSNVLKGWDTHCEWVRLHSHFKKPGLWGFCYSARHRRDAPLQTVAFPLSSAKQSRSFIDIPTTSTAETGPQVPEDSYRTWV